MRKKIITHLSDGSDYNMIQDIAFGFQKSQLLFTGIQYDIFSLISEGNNTVEKLASVLDVNKDALERLLNALVAIDLLDKHSLKYTNKTISEKHLTRNSKQYYGFLSHYADLWDSWGTLSNVLKTGEVITSKALHEKDDNFIEYFLRAEDWYDKLEMPFVRGMIKLDGVKNFIKIGANGFRYPLYIAQNFHDMPVCIVDNERMIETLKRILQNEDIPSNLQLLVADYKNGKIEKQFDVVYMDSLIDSNSVVDNIKTLQTIYKIVSNGGRLLIHQQLINSDRTEPTISALKSINLLLNTKSGAAYTQSDIWVILKEADFDNIQFHKTNVETHIVEAYKSILG